MKRVFSLTVSLSTIVIVIVSTNILASARQDQRLHRITRINEYDNCKDRPPRPHRFLRRNIVLARKYLYAVNAEGINVKGSKLIEKVIANLTKCSDRSKVKCEHFTRLEWKGSPVICPMLASRVMPWSTIVYAFSPPLLCAFPKGNFTVRNMTIDYEAVSKLKIGPFTDYWIINYEFYDENMTPWSCFTGEFDYPRVRG